MNTLFVVCTNNCLFIVIGCLYNFTYEGICFCCLKHIERCLIYVYWFCRWGVLLQSHRATWYSQRINNCECIVAMDGWIVSALSQCSKDCCCIVLWTILTNDRSPFCSVHALRTRVHVMCTDQLNNYTADLASLYCTHYWEYFEGSGFSTLHALYS